MRIGIVNDSPQVADFLRRIIGLESAHEVVWTALSGIEAAELCAKDVPDLVLMDLRMPGMDGIEATRRIMMATPCPILIVAGSVRADAGHVCEAMGHGALDAVDTPQSDGRSLPEAAAPLLTKIAMIARLVGPGRDAGFSAFRASPPFRHDRLVAIGASAGGPAALALVLRGLPKDFSAAIVIVQHVDEKFASGMADWLGQESALPVRLAAEGDRPQVGVALLASTGDHLVLKTSDRLGYTAAPIDYVYRPSVDEFFHSVCRLWRGEAIGVLLTGMGRDGALGLKALRERGHHTIAQDQATSAVYGMPRAAAALNAAIDVLPAGSIAPKLLEMLKRNGDR